MTPLENVLSRLKGVKEVGKGWQALCPAHNDKRPSLKIDEGDDGRVLLKCWAGCEAASVVSAIGLAMADLFPERNGRRPTAQYGQHQPEAVYDYHDENGKLLFQVVRFPGKQFRQRRPDGAGGWEWNLKGVRRVLYRLPEVLAAVERGDTIFLCEGEKDADNLREHGFAATTPGNAGSWRDEYSDIFKGANVVILPDNDEPGRNHAKDVAKELSRTARNVKIVELPDLPEKGDVTDWLAAGGTADELRQIVAETKAYFGRTPAVVRVADVEREETSWLWQDRIPLGKLTLIEGDPGLGKSWLTLVLAANITRGWPLPDNGDDPTPREPANVVLLSAEDGAGDTIRPRLEDAEADLERVFLLTGSQEDPDAGVSLEADLDLLDQVARDKKPLLIVVDPLQAYLGSGVDMHRSNETRPILAALARLAERHGCAVVLVRHLRKTSGDRAIYRGLGSIDFTGAARSVLRVGQDPADEQKRVIVQVKTNLGPVAKGLAFTIDTGQFRWLGVSNVTAEQMDAPDDPEEKTALEEAVDFLEGELRDGPRVGKEVQREAKRADISSRTLRRAREQLGIRPYKERGKGGRWMWALPDHDKTSPKGAKLAKLANIPETASRAGLNNVGQVGQTNIPGHLDHTEQVGNKESDCTLAHMAETPSTSNFEPCMQVCKPNIPCTLTHLESEAQQADEEELPW
ncbi:MAG: AAA family ATPase [Limnochordia bacterium]|jgi:putative DNA primase/helicase